LPLRLRHLPPLSFTRRRPPPSTLFPYTTLFRSLSLNEEVVKREREERRRAEFEANNLRLAQKGLPLEVWTEPTEEEFDPESDSLDRKSTRLNSSHVKISYAVFCLKKKTDSSSIE